MYAGDELARSLIHISMSVNISVCLLIYYFVSPTCRNKVEDTSVHLDPHGVNSPAQQVPVV